MTTQFYKPVNISQQLPSTESSNELINWVFNGPISENNYAVSEKPLYTISGLWMEKYLSNTTELVLTNFKIPNIDCSILGIEFLLKMQRSARIEDLRIQLTLNDSLIGDNLASPINPVQSNMYTGDNSVLLPIVGDTNIYGGAHDLWGTTLTSNDISNSSFGIVISFRSNQIYPHRDLVYINEVGIRITYG